jgi:rhodanese-related sulfurtransferase
MTKAKASSKSRFPVWGWFVLIVTLAAAAIFFILNNPGSAVPALAKEISPVAASQYQKDGALMLDVREPAEWDAGHISGAVLIPLGELPSRLNEIPKDREIVVVCRSGNRSASGRDILLNAGYASVTSMGGGMNQWATAGLPVVTGP